MKTTPQETGEAASLFIKNLEHLMSEENMKNKELADYLELSRSAISNYLAGVSRPRTEVLEKIAAKFDITIDELLKKDLSIPENPEPINTTLRETSFRKEAAVCSTPLFERKLSETPGSVYREENYCGRISLPFLAYKDTNCFAVKMWSGESLKSANISSGDVVIFEKDTEVSDGEVAAVHLKAEHKIVIRRVSFKKNQVLLEANSKPKPYKNDEITILGKVIKILSFADVE